MDIINKWNIYWIVFGLLVFLKDIRSYPRNHQDNYNEDDKFLPNFLTLSQKFRVPVGSTIILPCKLNKTENSNHYILAWKRNIAVLTAGNVKVTVNTRLRLIKSDDYDNYESNTKIYNLEIRDIRLSDSGEYVCQIGSMIPQEIHHILEVLIPPKITKISPTNHVHVEKGDRIRLECEAEGNPKPEIIWTRKNNVMLNGEPNVVDNVFEVEFVNRHTSGLYRCTADNGVGQPDTREFDVNVKYPPEIEIEKLFIHTGIGTETKLTCFIHSEPLSNIIWYKDTTQLGTTEQHSQQNHGSRYNLIIRNVSISDLGNYTCQASNILGKARQSMILTATPTICVFDSPTISNYRELYNISWSVQSYSPIREYRIYYRKQLAPINQLQIPNNRPYSESINNDLSIWNDGNDAATTNSKTQFGQTYVANRHQPTEQEKWKIIIIPENFYIPNYNGGIRNSFGAVNSHKNIRQSSYYLFRNLQAGRNYEVKIQARNDFGWNKLSQVFNFSTRNQQLELEQSAQPAVSKTAGVLNKDFPNQSCNKSESILSVIVFGFISIIFQILFNL